MTDLTLTLPPTPAPSPEATSPAPGRVALRATGVSVRIGGRAILDRVDLDVHAGEVLVLVGPNGAGKSTLLAVLAGDRRPDRGRVTLDGLDVAGLRMADLARRRAVLLQEERVEFLFRVVDVVRMGRAPWRGTDAERDDEAEVEGAMDVADVRHLAERRFPTLSGGEKGRSSFARVLAQTTSVALLDEPTAALDVHHQQRLLEEVRACAAVGAAVVVVLHDLAAAAGFADRIALLDDGRVRAVGAPREVLRSDVLSEVYRHPLEVLAHPTTGQLVVLPRRATTSVTGGERA